MTSESVPAALLEAREKIDQTDRELITLLARRFELTYQVGLVKAENSLNSVDAEREAQKLAALREACAGHRLNPDLVTELFTKIMQEVVQNHEQLRQQKA